MDDPWRIVDLDLEAYLAHIGETERAPSREALAALHRAHRRAFSFENLDVLLGQHPGVSLEAVQAKFVGGTRGGYCFEQITLFAAALERLGYAVVRHLARVGHSSQSPRTHLVALVEMGHHWTSTHPRTHFRSSLMVTGLTEDGAFLGLSLDGVTERRPGLPTRHTQLPTAAHELGRQLARVRIRPTPDELDRLEAKLAELRGRPSQ